MATFPISQCQDGVQQEVTALKDAAENLNRRKNTSNWVRVLRTGEMKMALSKTPKRFVLSTWIKYSSGFLLACVNKTEPTKIVSVICHP